MLCSDACHRVNLAIPRSRLGAPKLRAKADHKVKARVKSAFGQTLFGGGWFVRWTLSPFVVLFAVVMPLLVEKWTLKVSWIIAGSELLCIALLAGFWLPARIGRWAFRIVAAAVFVIYSAYLIHQFFFSDTAFTLVGRPGETSPRNALLGFVIIGLPSLWYALFGRFTFRKPQPEVMQSKDEATP
jgi:hypothetical protein